MSTALKGWILNLCLTRQVLNRRLSRVFNVSVTFVVFWTKTKKKNLLSQAKQHHRRSKVLNAVDKVCCFKLTNKTLRLTSFVGYWRVWKIQFFFRPSGNWKVLQVKILTSLLVFCFGLRFGLASASTICESRFRRLILRCERNKISRFFVLLNVKQVFEIVEYFLHVSRSGEAFGRYFAGLPRRFGRQMNCVQVSTTLVQLTAVLSYKAALFYYLFFVTAKKF